LKDIFELLEVLRRYEGLPGELFDFSSKGPVIASLWAVVAHRNLVPLPGMVICRPKRTHSGHFPACKTAFSSGLYSKSSGAGDTKSLMDLIFAYLWLVNRVQCPFAFTRAPVGPPPVDIMGWCAKFEAYIIWVIYLRSIALGGNGRAPLGRGSIILGAVVGVPSMAVSVIPRKVRLSGTIVEAAAPRDWPTVESVGLRVGNDRAGTEDIVLECMTRGSRVCEEF